jgi:hypothetical protein
MKNNNKSFFKIVDGKSVPFNPLDVNGKSITYGAVITMPEPNGTDDCWSHGGFIATVWDSKDNGKLITVEDSDGDFFDVEPNRVELVEDNDDDDEEVTRLKDEKSGLYPDKIDIAN